MKTYAVKEIFLTLQGEGARAGTRAVFVRLSGCNLWSGHEADRAKGRGACARWCDTDFVGGEKLSAAAIMDRMDTLWQEPAYDSPHPRWCVLTGGEPTLQVDVELLYALKADGWMIAMETNGTVNPLDEHTPGPADSTLLDLIDHLTVSPKLGSSLKRLTAHELRVVVPGQRRLDSQQIFALALPDDRVVVHWTAEALERLADAGRWGSLYVSPMDAPDGLGVPTAIDLVLRQLSPRWRLSVQAHKTLKLP